MLFTRHLRRRSRLVLDSANRRLSNTLLEPEDALPLRLAEGVQQCRHLHVDTLKMFQIGSPGIDTQAILYRGGRQFEIISGEVVISLQSEEDDKQFTRPSVSFVDKTLAPSGWENMATATIECEEDWLQQMVTQPADQTLFSSSTYLQRLMQPAHGGLLLAAPGLNRGIRFQRSCRGMPNSGSNSEEENVAQVENELARDREGSRRLIESRRNPKRDSSRDKSINAEEEGEVNYDKNYAMDGFMLDSFLPVEFPSLQPKGKLEQRKQQYKWAHMVDLSQGSQNFGSLAGGAEMARTWPFELDPFQKEAIYHLECGDSVFVAAHTSAGKTVVAEYAIALAQKHQTKMIYTSPIKALSNQKFRDFKQTFGDVGILTGDVQINAEAKCLVMTTEILRSKLYSRADLLREVEFVVFDEVHYVSDYERGVVWEEVIILLPDHVSLILLSATVPNTYEFASWIGRTKRRDVYVISTAQRPVPLEHFLWSGKGLERIVSAERKWQEGGYREVVQKSWLKSSAVVASSSTRNQGRGGSRHRGSGVTSNRSPISSMHLGKPGRIGGMASLAQDKTLWGDVVRYLRKAALLPACIFVFSRIRCEEFAQSLGSLDFCDTVEKIRIRAIYARSISRLAREDRSLPQIGRLRELAVRGIAVHHGGLLPIVKEIVELLFAQSLVKVLFATETFAVGLNLPTRTVVFSDHRKFDGARRRVLSPGEYTQMAGRAGRRGLDTVGTVVLVPAGDTRDVAPAETLKELILGQPNRLTSQFRLTYNMILNLHRVETLRVEDMMKRSFSENASQSRRAELEARIRMLEIELASVVSSRPTCPACDNADYQRQQQQQKEEMQQYFQKNSMSYCYLAAQTFRLVGQQMLQKLARLPKANHDSPAVFSRGRLLVFLNENGVRAIGIIAEDFSTTGSPAPLLSVIEIRPSRPLADSSDALSFVPALRRFMLPSFVRQPSFRTVSVALANIEHLTNTILSVDNSNKESTVQDIVSRQLISSFSYLMSWESTIWDDIDLSYISDADIVRYVKDRQATASLVAESPALACPDFVNHYFLRQKEWLVQDRLSTLRHEINDSKLALQPEYKNRLAVLTHLGFVNTSAVVMLKGRVACEIRTADELILTEVILNNLLADLDPPAVAALLSIFVYQGKDDTNLESAPLLSVKLNRALANINRIRKQVIQTQEEFHVFSAGDDTESSTCLHFGLMDVVFEWASGSPFKAISSMTTEQEGTIVRTITRLEETCREIRNIGRIIGDTSLQEKMSAVTEAIIRNITTVPSLYL